MNRAQSGQCVLYNSSLVQFRTVSFGFVQFSLVSLVSCNNCYKHSKQFVPSHKRGIWLSWMIFLLSYVCLTVASPGLRNWWSRRINLTIYHQDSNKCYYSQIQPIYNNTEFLVLPILKRLQSVFKVSFLFAPQS